MSRRAYRGAGNSAGDRLLGLSLLAMDLALFSADGLASLLRWAHFVAGFAWLGLLYTLHFVLGPFLAAAEAPVRTGFVRGFLPRALAWFRWTSLATVLAGLALLLVRVAQAGPPVLGHSWGVVVQLGSAIGVVLFLNVWLLLWPQQRIVIASAESVATGGPPDPRAALAIDRAFLVARVNVLLSVPMLWLMGAAAHLPIFGGGERGLLPTLLSLALVLAVEAIAVWGKRGVGPAAWLEKVWPPVGLGVALSAAIYLLLELAST